jgi:hypothetical protein
MAYAFHVIPIGQKHMVCKRRGKKKKNESSLEALLHGCRELLDKKWRLNEQSMVQIQKVLSKHRALNKIVLHNHYYQKHAFKNKKNLV